MRQLLDLLKLGRRDPDNPSRTGEAAASKPDPARNLIIAGEAMPRAQETPPSVSVAAAESVEEPDSQSLVDVVKSRQKDRWQPPELDGPEFGGLIERRGVDVRGLMPTKYEEAPLAEHRKNQQQDEAKPAVTPEGDVEVSLESTGMFLASLENSAITLADSGLFKVADEPQLDEEPAEEFIPYHRHKD